MAAAALQRSPSFWAAYEVEAHAKAPAVAEPQAAPVGSPVADLWARIEGEYLDGARATPG